MFSTLRTRFGIPGVISVIALVFAMLGGAYAASNGSGPLASSSAKHHKKHKKSKAQRGPRGPKGATGPAGPTGPMGPAGLAGPAGPAGAKGDNGSSGSDGSNGSNGADAEAVSFSGNQHGCPEGGVEVNSASPTTYVCNGAKGANGTTGFASELPPGETEVGTWAVGRSMEDQVAVSPYIYAPISFPFPLPEGEGYSEGGEAREILVEYMAMNATPTANCPGSASNPLAAEGFMCVYVSAGTSGIEPRSASGFPEYPDVEPESGHAEFGVGRVGTVLTFKVSAKNSWLLGTWAVTARS